MVALPAFLLWKASKIEVEAGDEEEEEEEEEEEISFVEEVKRMRSVLNTPLFAGAFALIISTVRVSNPGGAHCFHGDPNSLALSHPDRRRRS